VRIVAIGSSRGVAIVDSLVDDGHEVHSIDSIRPPVRWLASHTHADLDTPDALVAGVARVGAIIDEVHVFGALDPAVLAVVVAAARPLGMDETGVAVVAHYV
jgi:hypothetical protein